MLLIHSLTYLFTIYLSPHSPTHDLSAPPSVLSLVTSVKMPSWLWGSCSGSGGGDLEIDTLEGHPEEGGNVSGCLNHFLESLLETCFPSSLGIKLIPDGCVLGQNCEPPEEVSTVWGRGVRFLSLPSCSLPSPPSTHTPRRHLSAGRGSQGPRSPRVHQSPLSSQFLTQDPLFKSHFKAFIRFRIKRPNSTYGEISGWGQSSRLMQSLRP